MSCVSCGCSLFVSQRLVRLFVFFRLFVVFGAAANVFAFCLSVSVLVDGCAAVAWNSRFVFFCWPFLFDVFVLFSREWSSREKREKDCKLCVFVRAGMTNEYREAPRDAITLPRPGTKFRTSAVEKVIKDVCEALVGNRPYVHDEVQPLIKDICGEIQQRVVRLGYERYKLVTHVIIMEAAHQGMRIASRGLWDPVTDGYAVYTHSTESMHVNVVLYGLYWE